jgi:predicted RNase H-like HicB family nuclease
VNPVSQPREVDVVRLRNAIEVLKCARDNIEEAIMNLYDAITSPDMREVYLKYATKMVEAALEEVKEALEVLKSG